MIQSSLFDEYDYDEDEIAPLDDLYGIHFGITPDGILYDADTGDWIDTKGEDLVAEALDGGIVSISPERVARQVFANHILFVPDEMKRNVNVQGTKIVLTNRGRVWDPDEYQFVRGYEQDGVEYVDIGKVGYRRAHLINDVFEETVSDFELSYYE